MEKEELKRLFQEELKAYASANLLTKEVFDQFKTDMEKQYGEAIGKTEFEKSFEKLSNDLTKKLEENRPVVEGNKEFKEKLHNAIKNFDISNPNSKQYFTTTQLFIGSKIQFSESKSQPYGSTKSFG